MSDKESISRREALKGGSAAAVAVGAGILQDQLIGTAKAQTNEPRIQLGPDYAIDDKSPGFVIEHQPSGATFQYDENQNRWVATDPVEVPSLIDGAGVTHSGELEDASHDHSGEAINPNTVNTDGAVIGDYHFASKYDGADADARLDNALSTAPEGSAIYLEAATYSDTRTISTAYTLIGTGTMSSGTVLDNGGSGGSWTLSDNSISIRDFRTLNSFGLTIDAQRCTVENVVEAGGGITVANNNNSLYDISFGSVTFQSGTSGNVIDVSSDISVTDNGTNTVGDTS